MHDVCMASLGGIEWHCGHRLHEHAAAVLTLADSASWYIPGYHNDMAIGTKLRQLLSPESEVAKLKQAPCTDSPPHAPALYHQTQFEVVPSVIGQTGLGYPLSEQMQCRMIALQAPIATAYSAFINIWCGMPVATPAAKAGGLCKGGMATANGCCNSMPGPSSVLHHHVANLRCKHREVVQQIMAEEDVFVCVCVIFSTYSVNTKWATRGL